jgi:hypothetical protein
MKGVEILGSLKAGDGLIRRAGAERVAGDAAVELGHELLIVGSKAAARAVELAREKRRKTVRAEDVKEALRRLRSADHDHLISALGLERKLACPECGKPGAGPYVYTVRSKHGGKVYSYRYLFLKHSKGRVCSLGRPVDSFFLDRS